MVLVMPLAAWADSSTFEKLQTIVTEQCRGSKRNALVANGEFERQSAVASMHLMCECMPKEVERRVGADPALREMSSKQEALSLLQAAVRSCGAIHARKELASACMEEAKKDSEIADAEAHCGCVRAKVDAVTDDDLVNDSDRAYREFQARVDAKQKNQAMPPRTPSIIDGISASCKSREGR
jgi:hypothetical protein